MKLPILTNTENWSVNFIKTHSFIGKEDTAHDHGGLTFLISRMAPESLPGASWGQFSCLICIRIQACKDISTLEQLP